jgi:hypothetical protein
MFTMALLSTLLGEQAQSGFNLRPLFIPTIRTENVAKGRHGIDIGFCPVHARAFETGFHDELIAALHTTAADWSTLWPEEGILDLLFSFFEVGQVGGNGFGGWACSLRQAGLGRH